MDTGKILTIIALIVVMVLLILAGRLGGELLKKRLNPKKQAIFTLGFAIIFLLYIVIHGIIDQSLLRFGNLFGIVACMIMIVSQLQLMKRAKKQVKENF